MIHVAGGSEPSNATCHGKCFESVAEMLDSCLQAHTVHHIGIEKWQDLDLIAWLCDCVYEQKVFFEKCHKTNIVLHWPCSDWAAAVFPFQCSLKSTRAVMVGFNCIGLGAPAAVLGGYKGRSAVNGLWITLDNVQGVYR